MAHILLEKVTLDLPIYDVKARSLKKRLMFFKDGKPDPSEATGTVIFRALDSLSFKISKGDRIGLVGHNGAGKSTLLRMLAGIYSPTSGSIQAEGKTVPLLDISMGMDDNSTGWQNVRLRGLLLGMTDEEILEKQDEIAHFAELGSFMNMPVRTYSNGMRVRLGFAISTAVDADILLLDEVMGVGDATFRDKANRRLVELHDRSEIVVLALHDNNTIRRTCEKVLWLEKGKAKMFGPVEEVLAAYEQAVS